MANYRTVYLSFWDDSMVTGEFTPEDKYFYLYMLTNNHTRLCGCFEISIRAMAFELGYSEETTEKLLSRFENVYHKIIYDKETKEVLILNWLKYNNNSSPKFRIALENEISKVKSPSFRNYLKNAIHGSPDSSNDDEHEESSEYGYPIDRVCESTVTVNDTDTDTDTVKDEGCGGKKPSCEYSDEFEQFWSEYPYHRGVKKKAFKCFEARLREGYTAEQLIQCSKNYADYVKANRVEEKYIKHGATFLSGSHDFESFVDGSGVADKNYYRADDYDEESNREALKKIYGM